MDIIDIPAITAGVVAYFIARRLRSTKQSTDGVCVFHTESSQSVKGAVTLRSRGKNQTLFECNLSGLSPGLHGFHVHKFGDLREECKSACEHYNPHNTTHGGRSGHKRHKGDLGNLIVTEDGTCNDTFIADVSVDEIIGRMLIIHDGEDDLGKGGNAESLKTGNAGPRLACGVIGLTDHQRYRHA